MTYKNISFLMLLLFGTSVYGQDHGLKTSTNFEQAKTLASESDRNILMVFAGSDWCRPCIKFKRDILHAQEFTQYADMHLVVLYLDFPSQKKNKLSDVQTTHNEKLAEKYNSNGAFPSILLLDPQEKVLGKLSFHNQSPEEFVNECKAVTPKVNKSTESLVPAKKVLKLMGCRFEVKAVATTDTLAWAAIEAGVAEISRIEKLISSWDPNSQTSKINASAGKKPVCVDQELFDLVKRAKKISELTDGAFDISFASMENIWVFDGEEHELPDSSAVASASSKIDWQKVVLDDKKSSVFLKDEGMKIGFGAIGKGYAANKAKALMAEMPGVSGGVVNASGDLVVWGQSVKPEGWTIQIADPKNNGKSLGFLTLEDMAIVTSGDYEKFFTNNGTRYAHIVDPTTGYPTTGVKSVSVICPDTEIADALATSIFVLGKDKGIGLVDQLDQIECMVVTVDNELFTSKNLKLNYY